MDDVTGPVDESGISRRSALKKIGTGAAIAWTAPVLMSASAKAFAASAAPGCAKGGICDFQGFCGGEASPCSCFHTTDGHPNFCANTDFICGNPVCNTSADCAPGQACVASCCPTNVCVDPCVPGANPTQPHNPGQARGSL
jgi:hypothetical protein